MPPPPRLDASTLPDHAFGHRSLMWWGTMGLIAIEGTVFALCIASYFYLYSHASTWPPTTPPPDLYWGSINTLVMLASVVPNQWTKMAAERQNLQQVRIGVVLCLLFAFVFLAIRIWEFRTVNCRWDSDAYGSIVWMLMGLHTLHLLADVYDSVVLALLMFVGPVSGRRFVDVSENAMYWWFVVLAWLPIYAVVYWMPRLHGA